MMAIMFVGLGLSPKEIPSVLIGKEVPQFDLPALPERQKGLKTTDLQGQVSLVNVFASWCVSCVAEHPLFMKLHREGVVPVHGLNYKDGGDAAMAWLRRHGDPYDRVGADLKGRVGMIGVYTVCLRHSLLVQKARSSANILDRSWSVICKRNSCRRSKH